MSQRDGVPFLPPRDLSDFILRWPQFRAHAQALQNEPAADPQQRLVLNWLIALADRVGPADLTNDARPKAPSRR